jgi:hypothetical protein
MTKNIDMLYPRGWIRQVSGWLAVPIGFLVVNAFPAAIPNTTPRGPTSTMAGSPEARTPLPMVFGKVSSYPMVMFCSLGSRGIRAISSPSWQLKFPPRAKFS